MAAEVFISYSSQDQDRVVKIADKLRSAGVSIWVDESGIGAATLWSKEIAGAIKSCRVLVLMVTPNSVTSKNVVKEVSLAAEQNKQILPVILEPTEIPEALEYHLAGIQHLDVNGMSASESAEEILPALQRLLGVESEEAAATTHSVRLSRRRSFNIWADWRLYAFGIVMVAVAFCIGWLLKQNPGAPPPPPVKRAKILPDSLNKITFSGMSLALSRDGSTLVYTDQNKAFERKIGSLRMRIRVHNLITGEDHHFPRVELDRGLGVFCAEFSPDGKRLCYFETE